MHTAFKDVASFTSVLNKCTESYGFLVTINNSELCSNSIEDMIYWCRAPQSIPTFYLGSPVFWRLHEHYYDQAKAMEDDAEGSGSQTAVLISRSRSEIPERSTSIELTDRDGYSM